MADEDPRVGRKAILFALLGVLLAVFFPLIGFLAVLLLAIAWIFLVLVWITSGMNTRRPLVYIMVFTIAFVATLWILGKFAIQIWA